MISESTARWQQSDRDLHITEHDGMGNSRVSHQDSKASHLPYSPVGCPEGHEPSLDENNFISTFH
jgi:hypothetical protein